jgi:NADH-quinone oxidoreductase subunit N
MLAEIFSFKKLLPLLVFAGLLLALFFNFQDWNTNISYFNSMMVFDNYAILFSSLIIQIVILWLLMSQNFFKSENSITDHYAIILFSVVGAILMTCFSNIIMLFIGLEILSISMYVLAASNKNSLRSNEAGLKYFLMGSFATGFLLFGIALIFGVTGSFNLAEITTYVNSNAAVLPSMFYGGIVLLLVGMLFKISAVPFHWWAPDVYEGSPTPVTAFMSTVVKTAAFAAFFKLFSTCFISVANYWTDILIIVSAASMIIGNLLAVSQTNLKRMLAYSSIAHAGYMLMAIIACNSAGSKALLIYTYAYAAASLGAFAILNIMGEQLKSLDITSLIGLSKKHPQMAVLITIIMLSFAGIPPLAGFFAKYYMFYSVIEQGHIWLVIIAVVSSLIGVYYYLRPVITMYTSSKEENQISFSQSNMLFMLLIVLVLLFLGFAPQLLIDLL